MLAREKSVNLIEPPFSIFIQTNSRRHLKLPNLEHESGNKFLEVQRAWEILGDPRSRALYDDELGTLRQDYVTADDVSLEDMTLQDAGNCFELSHHCRCGDYFSVDSSELAEMGYPFIRNRSKVSLRIPGSLPASVILPCGSCSLRIRLHIDSDIAPQS